MNTVQQMKRVLMTSVGTLLAACVLTGCATGAKAVNMMPTQFAVENKLGGSVCPSVEGGEKTNPMLISNISSEDFLTALTESLTRSGVFTQMVGASDADYLLRVIITDMEQPIAGFDMTVYLTSHWMLTKRSTNRVVFSEKIRSKFTATVGDEFLGVERVRKANEGAARENIKDGIHRLSQLKL
jgi:hypothetical protein